MRFTRAMFIAVLSAAAVSLTAAVPAAVAAPPSNDLVGGATAVGLGDGAALDTSDATTDTLDAAINANCGAPATDASVWYSYTAATDGGVIVDVSGSNYTAGVIVVSGPPDAFLVHHAGSVCSRAAVSDRSQLAPIS
jgi:streptogramin lyase